ncbi:MAG: DUF3536 domain-containing protein, partial [Thermomicrobiaceae bacterium]|nr:DUF3536 domain-containing protein [Thermomicrobiaceae bacterium]
QRSSWGCPHELLRWRGDCSCTPGDGHWKADLRAAFDDLAAAIDEATERALDGLVDDVWALRDDYVEVVIGAVAERDWLARHGLPTSGPAADRIAAAFAAQRWRLAMYASCAFYWDDLTRIEAGYGVRSGLHAARLADAAFGTRLVERFGERLAHVTGWRTSRSAAELYAAR